MSMKYAEPSSGLANTVAALSPDAIDEIRVEKIGVEDTAKEREIVKRKAELIKAERVEQEEQDEIERKATEEAELDNLSTDNIDLEIKTKTELKKPLTEKEKTEAMRDISEALSSMMSESAVEREKEKLAELLGEYEKLSVDVSKTESISTDSPETFESKIMTNESLASKLDEMADSAKPLIDSAKSIEPSETEILKTPKDEELGIAESVKDQIPSEQQIDQLSTKQFAKFDSKIKVLLESIEKEIKTADSKIGESLSIVKDKNNEKSISLEDAQEVIKSDIDSRIPHYETRKILHQLDRKHDGKLDIDELDESADIYEDVLDENEPKTDTDVSSDQHNINSSHNVDDGKKN